MEFKCHIPQNITDVIMQFNLLFLITIGLIPYYVRLSTAVIFKILFVVCICNYMRYVITSFNYLLILLAIFVETISSTFN